MRRLLLVALCVVVGCGGGGAATRPHESTAARQVRMTVQAWLATLTTSTKKGDSARACSYLTPALRHSIDEQLRVRGETATCKTFAASWTGGNKPPGRLDAQVTAVTVRGTKATALLRAPPDSESDVKLRRLGGRWFIDSY